MPNSNLLDTVSSNSGLTVTKTYEPHRDVVTRVQNQFGSEMVSQYDYAYDALRRRASMTRSGPVIDTLPQPTIQEENISYTTNTLNQYTQITTSTGTIGLAYDDDGNLTNDDTFQYVYDAENRMIVAEPRFPTDGLHKVEMAYDYVGRRVSKTVSVYNAGVWTLDTAISFVYDGWNVIKDTTTTDSGNSTAYYVWGLDLSGTLQGAGGIGGLLLRKTDPGTFVYLYDANGNVEQLVNVADGSLAARYKYDPFGVLLVADGPEAESNPYRYSTQYFDTETGLSAYIFRYYSARLGRWTSRDPLYETGFFQLFNHGHLEPTTFLKNAETSHAVMSAETLRIDNNRYGAFLNAPVNAVDPFGLDVWLLIKPAFKQADKLKLKTRHCAILIEDCDGTRTIYETNEDMNMPELGTGFDIGVIWATGIVCNVWACKDVGVRRTVMPEDSPWPPENYWPNNYEPFGQDILTWVSLEEGHSQNQNYHKAAQRTKFYGYALCNQNCCEWTGRVIENAGGSWPLAVSINYGCTPGNPNGYVPNVP